MKNQIPQLVELAKSVELYDKSEQIGKKFSLHIDQVGELDAEIRDVLMGLSNSADFSKHIAERLEINKQLADLITKDVSTVIFEEIKKKIQTGSINAAQNELGNSSIEKVGGFSLEINRTDEASPVTPADKDKILSGIENPIPSRESYIAKKSASQEDEVHTEPLVDMLLNGGVSNPEQKTEKEAVEHAATEQVTEPAPKRAGPDPYREMPE